ncbi:MAG: ABC transporter permease [Flavobacteriales bacterium]|nr:MAG: ABC transporter permease [Flavobacteriales bacterium]
MADRLLLSISATLLRARLRQSVVAAVGVAISIGMYIALSGFMNGLNGLLDGLILNRTAHIRIYNEIRPAERQPLEIKQLLERATGRDLTHPFISRIKPKGEPAAVRNALAIIDALRKDPRVDGIAPKVSAQVFFNAGTIEVNGAIQGIEPLEEDRLLHFSDYLLGCTVSDLAGSSNGVVLGKGLADNMRVGIGDAVQVSTITGDRFTLKVIGFYQSGMADFDNITCFVTLTTAQNLLAQPRSWITDVQVRLKDLDMAPAVAREYARRFDADAQDIQTANAQFETGSGVRSLISYVVSVVLLLVAGFGIYNILNMMIYEKLDSIAILKATGFSGRDVRVIFINLSMIIGVFGAIAGLLLGGLLAIGIDHIPFRFDALPTITTYPVDHNPRYYLIGVAFALVTTLFAGLFPARKASRVDPVEIIRGK